LIETLSVLSSKISEFQCFNQYLKRLHGEHSNGYIILFTKNTKVPNWNHDRKWNYSAILPKTYIKYVFKLTYFIIKVSTFQRIVLLNFKIKYWMTFRKSKNFLFRLIRNIGTNNMELLKTKSNIVIILDNRNNYYRDIFSNI